MKSSLRMRGALPLVTSKLFLLMAIITVSTQAQLVIPSDVSGDTTKRRSEAPSLADQYRNVGIKPVQMTGGQQVCVAEGLVFVLINPSEFLMGSREDEKDRAVDEGPILRVQISRPFWIGKYEVTQREWTAIMGENPSVAKSGGDHPVENVSWEDCQRFIERLNKISSRRFRLPTEAEWEYACRAGGETVYCSGDTLSDLARCAWYEGNSTGAHHPVGQKDPNVWGLYDMHGNVYEWCQDFYRNTYSGRSGDGVAWKQPDENGNRVRRGGSYQQPSKNCRSAFRGTGRPESRRGDVGLRLVMEE